MSASITSVLLRPATALRSRAEWRASTRARSQPARPTATPRESQLIEVASATASEPA